MQRVEKKDIPIIEKLVQTEFSYVKKPKQQLESKINNPFFFLFKIVHQNQFAGFIEFEVLEENAVIRLNGLAVLRALRNKKLGSRLLHDSLIEIKQHGFQTVFLLVKQQNAIAKKMYEHEGFRFSQTLPKPIDNAIVDEYQLAFEQPTKTTISIV